MKPKTIAVIGAGPVGGILAAHLLSAGHEVLLVDTWKEHIEHIRANGLHLSGKHEMLVRPTQLFASIGDLGDIKPECVFLCTKACYLDSVLDTMSNALKESSAVFISFQNGIDTERVIAERLGAHRVLRGVVSYAGVLTGPGEIRESFFAPNYLGWLDPQGVEACKEVAVFLSASGLETEATGEIARYAWRKTIFNTCTMAIAAVTGLNMQEMQEFLPTARLADDLLRESIAVAEANGFEYGADFFEIVREFNLHAGPHRPSMLVDIENGRRTENAFLVRRLAEYADLKGVPAPLHRTLATVIDALELRGCERHREQIINDL
jgi:2-dehydropantoate 2-reductase